MESATIMETSLNGLGLGVPSVSQLKSSAVPVVLGAVGAGVGLFAVGKLLSYPLPGVGAIDAKLDSLLPSKPGLLPCVARVGHDRRVSVFVDRAHGRGDRTSLDSRDSL